jgi:thymidylate kinase
MLIFIDGIDGTGKSTLVTNLFDRILAEPVDRPVTTFPFPTRIPEGAEKADPFSRTMFHLNDFHETMRNHKRLNDIRICDRSFITTMAYQGYNDTVGQELVNPRFHGIMSLGAEALLSTRNPSDMTDDKDVFFIYVKCDPEVASKRVLGRTTDRVDDIERVTDPKALTERLATLQDRLELCYAHVRMNINVMFPQHRYYFYMVDSTDTGPDALLEDVLQQVKQIGWPDQQSLV